MDQYYDHILKEAAQIKEDNKIYLTYLASLNPGQWNQDLLDTHQKVFRQTNCMSCANCCKTIPALITPEDVKRIARSLDLSPKVFIKQYVIIDYNGDMLLNGVPCKFLGPDNACKIYAVRPEACKRYPHTDETLFFKRTAMNLANTLVCPAAFKIVEQLKKVIPSP